MSSNHHHGQGAAETAQALLAVFTLQPPPDFAAQILARVQERQAEALAYAPVAVSPPTSLRSPEGFWKTSRHTWHSAWWPRVALVSALLMGMAILRWAACTQPPAALSADTNAESLPAAVVAAAPDEPAPLPPAVLQAAATPEAAQHHDPLAVTPLEPQARETTAPPPTPSAHLALANQVERPSDPQSAHAAQPQSSRHKGKQATRRLRPPRA